MEMTINEQRKPFWTDVNEADEFSQFLFSKVPHSKISIELHEELQKDLDTQLAFHSNLGSITVLDRMTGFSFGRDIETGFRDPEGKFWLASGGVNVIDGGCETVGEAIEWIKQRANNCIGE